MYGRRYCRANSKIEFNDPDYSELKGRYDGCPLVAAPPHGRVGDLDELKAKIKKEDNAYGFDSYGDGMYDAFQSVYQCIDAQPTIIPAEEDEI